MSNQKRKAAVKKLKVLSYNAKTDVNMFRRKIEEEFRTVFLPSHTEKQERTFGGITCDFLIPEIHASKRILFYIHGGCFVGGSRASYRNFTSMLANKAYSRTVVPEYRLAPAHPFPAAIDDVQAAFRAMFAEEEAARNLEAMKRKENLNIFGMNAEPIEEEPEIIVAADGAGASIACAMLFNLRERYKKCIKKLVLFSPWLDISDSSPLKTDKKTSDEIMSGEVLSKSSTAYSYSSNLSNPLVSPLYASREFFQGFPSTYIQIGEKEILLDDAKEFLKLVKNAGVDCTLDIWNDMMHLFQMAGEFLDEAHEALDKFSYIVASDRESKQNEETISVHNKPRLEKSLESEA